MSPYRVIHVLRAPVGGLFRHVRDLVAAQRAMGLEIGVICDNSSADRLTEARLAALATNLSLGLHKIAMSRDLGPSDHSAWREIKRLARGADGTGKAADVVHGHGAKGGAYARLAAASVRRSGQPIKAFYTPHGGSLHYHPRSLKGRIYMTLERNLEGLTDGLIFESAYSEQTYRSQVGTPACSTRVIPNGLLPEEFGDHAPAATAADVLFVGELRRLKGVDVLLDAIAVIRRQRPLTALIVGDGPDAAEFKAQATRLGLDDIVRFPGAMPAAQAFPQGRVLVMPSRAESFPYLVLEAAAAGIPLIASKVGGIPEIVAGTDTVLVPPDDAAALAARIETALADPAATLARAARLKRAVSASFTVAGMARAVVQFYAEAARFNDLATTPGRLVTGQR